MEACEGIILFEQDDRTLFVPDGAHVVLQPPDDILHSREGREAAELLQHRHGIGHHAVGHLLQLSALFFLRLGALFAGLGFLEGLELGLLFLGHFDHHSFVVHFLKGFVIFQEFEDVISLYFLFKEIETCMKDLDKHTKIRIQSWCKKFCQIISNTNWKKNRNLHALNLLDMLLNEHFEEPYNKFPPEGPLPFLSIPVVKNRLSPKILNYAKLVFNSDDNIGENKKNIEKELLNKNKMKLEINKCTDPDLLKRLIEKLKFKVDETRKIINEQNEEKKILAKKVSQLENLLKSYKI